MFQIYSSRVAALRKHTRGYTGQKSVALRYQYPSVNEIQGVREKVKELVSNGFKSLNVLEYNQFVRGSLFILMDTLLTNEIKKREKGDVEAIVRMSEEVISMICKWIDYFSKNYKDYLEAIQTPNLYLLSLNHAIVLSLPELSEILKLTFCQINRCKSKFTFISREFDTTNIDEDKFKRINLEAFYKYKGIDNIVALITNTKVKYPIEVITDLLDPLVGILDLLKDAKSDELSSMLYKEVTARFSNLGDKDIKELTKPSLDKLMNILSALIPVKEASVKIRFGIGVQLLKSTYIQKKLFGINVIKNMVSISIDDTPMMKQLIALCEEEKLLDIVLGENAHTEILRKMEEVFVFLLVNKKLSMKYVERLWKCGNEKYEDIMRTCLNLLANLVIKMEYSMIEELFKLIKAANYQNEILIQFLESYTLNTFKVIINREEKKDLKKNLKEYIGKYFDLNLFWKLLEDSSQTPAKLKEQAIKALVTIFTKHNFMIEGCIRRALNSIKKGEIVIWCIKLLKDVNFVGCLMESMGKQKGHNELESLNNNFSIIQETLKDCEIYHKKVKSLIKDKKTVMDTDFGTGFIFSHQTQAYIDFLLYLCSKSALRISKEEFVKLWKCYVEEAFCEPHADILFSAIMKESNTPMVNSFTFFSNDIARSVFEEFLCGKQVKLTSCGFSCFCTYMVWLSNKLTDKPSLEKYPGFPMLWKIAFHSEVDRIREEANNFLVEFIEDLCTCNKTKRAEITEKVLDLALSNVEDVNNVPQVQTALRIIEAIIEKVECEKPEEIGPEYSYPPLITFQIELKDSNNVKVKQVKINENMKIRNLRCLLSNEFKKHKSFITIMGHNNNKYTDDNEFSL